MTSFTLRMALKAICPCVLHQPVTVISLTHYRHFGGSFTQQPAHQVCADPCVYAPQVKIIDIPAGSLDQSTTMTAEPVAH
eukprot:5648836-Karenia_brevis.AAC.1